MTARGGDDHRLHDGSPGHEKRPTRPRVALFSPYGYLSICTSVTNAAVLWESRGYGVDIYVPVSTWDLPGFGSADIQVHQVPEPRGRRLTRNVLALSAAKAAGRESYAHTIGYDLEGLTAAAAVARRCRCRYSYHSLELRLREDMRGLRGRFDKTVETFCAGRAQLVVAQDATRMGVLCRDLRLGAERTAIVPNTPLGLHDGGKSPYLRERFGIDEETFIVLQSGSLISNHRCLDVMESVGSWPEGFALVVHGWAPFEDIRRRIIELAAQAPGRIHVSFDVLPMDAVDTLYASSDVGLALYGSPDMNFRAIGHSAGKVFRYMRAGVPVIVQDLPGLSELVREAGCGAAVRSAAEIASALETMRPTLGSPSHTAMKAFERYEFSAHYDPVMERLTASA